MASYTVTHAKAASFYDRYERKSELQHQTHYCPGCGHGVAHKLIARALDDLRIGDRTILVSPVGCSVFAYYYFDVGNIQAAHGRAVAVATGVKRARPDSIVISYQGDGDLAAIGSAEIIHAANRGENLTVFFINNAIYGMTGGQLAPTSLVGQETTTTPCGRDPYTDGYPLHVCELLNALQAPVYLERVSLGDNKGIMRAAKAVRRALENQIRGLGFSLVEILSPCPTVWKKTPLEAKRWVREEMTSVFPLGVFRDRSEETPPRRSGRVCSEEVPGDAAHAVVTEPEPPESDLSSGREARGSKEIDLEIRVAGFGGQGVLLLGQVLAEAGLEAGLEVSWLPSYGPEMRSGTSNCHVRIASHPIDSPMVCSPNVLLALNEPSLRKFLPQVVPGGWVFYNGAGVPEDCSRADVTMVARPFAELANDLGEPKAANIVMLGTALGATEFLNEKQVMRALARHVSSPKWLEIDRAALRLGLDSARARAPVDESGCGLRSDRPWSRGRRRPGVAR